MSVFPESKAFWEECRKDEYEVGEGAGAGVGLEWDLQSSPGPSGKLEPLCLNGQTVVVLITIKAQTRSCLLLGHQDERLSLSHLRSSFG